MRLRALLILLMIIASLMPAWLFNRYMKKVIQPQRSFALLFLYLLVIFLFVAAYTFLVVLLIQLLFPLSRQPV